MARTLLAFLCVSTTLFAQPRLDQHGDALPEGAIARFGTVRNRVGWQMHVPSWAMHPNGKAVAIEDLSGVTLWELESGRPLAHLHSQLSSNTLSEKNLGFSSDGKYLARVTSEQLEIFDVPTGRMLHEVKLENSSGHVVFLPNSTRLMISAGGHPMLTFDARTGKQVEAMEVERRIWGRSPSGKWLFGDGDERMYLLDATTGKVKTEYEDLPGWPKTFEWSRDGKQLYMAKSDGKISWFDLISGKRVDRIPAPKEWDAERWWDVALAHSLDGNILYMSTSHQHVFRLDLKTKRWLSPIPFAGRIMPHLNGKRASLLGADGILRQVDLATMKELPPPPGFDAAPKISPSLDGKYFAKYSPDDGVAMFDIAGKRLWIEPKYLAEAVHWVPNRREFLNVEGKRIVLGDPESGKALQVWETKADGSYSREIGFRPESDEFVIPAEQGFRIDRFRMKDKAIVQSKITEEYSDVIASSPNGQFVLFDSKETLKILNLKTYKVSATKKPEIENDTLYLARSAYAPDDSYLLTWEPEGIAVMRDPGTGVEFRRLSLAIPGYKWHHAFSPSAIWVAVSDGRSGVALWEIPSGQLIKRWNAHRQDITSLAFASPGRLLSSSDDMTALLWELRPKEKPKKPLWDALSGEDAVEAFRAVWAIADDPKGPELLRSKVVRVKAASAEQVKQWIAELADEKFAVRESATKELQTLGRLVEPELRAARAKAKGEEMGTRLDGLLAKIPRERSLQEVIYARAVAALELSASDAAKKLLAQWAAGAPGSRLTLDAKAALTRMSARAD